MAIPSADVLARSQFVGDAVQVSITGAALGTAAGPYTGWYLLYCAVAARFRMGATDAVTLSGVTKGTPLPAGTLFGPIWFDEASTTPAAHRYLNALTITGSATLELIPVT